MGNKENLRLKRNELREKYGDAIVRGVPATIVEPVLKNVWTPADKAEFVIKNSTGVTIHSQLIMTLNRFLESKLRCEAELDSSFKQVIPYVVVSYEDKIFCTHRLNGGDARLAGCYSIGTGGHIDESESIYDAFRRELFEEVGLTGDDYIGYNLEGYILDDTSEVNSVHLGVVITLKINRNDIHCLEQDKLAGEWLTYKELLDLYNEGKLESWSEITMKNLLLKEAHPRDCEEEKDCSPR